MSAVKKTVWVFALAILLLCFVVFYMVMQSRDLSLQPVIQNNNSEPVYLVSYADSADIFFQNRNAMNQSAINKGFDFIFNYRKELLDPNFIAYYADVFANQRGAGYWLWKPWIIMDTLQQIPENAILVYGDSNTLFKRPINDLIDVARKHDIILLQHPNLSRDQEAQLTTLEKLNCNSTECRKGPNVVACFMVLRNTAITRQFIYEWLENCKNREVFLRDDRESPELKEHLYDQPILGILAYHHRDKVKLLEYTFIRDNYIATAYRKPGLYEFYTQDAEIYKYSMLGRLEYKLSNTAPLVKLREYAYTKFKGFPWRATFFKKQDLEGKLVSPS